MTLGMTEMAKTYQHLLVPPPSCDQGHNTGVPPVDQMTRYKNMYFKNKTAANWENYRKHRSDCVKLTKQIAKEYFQSLNINSIVDNNCQTSIL